VVDQDAAHRLRRRREEVDPPLPLRVGLLHQAEIGVVQDGGRLEGVVRAFAPQVAGGERPEVVVDEGDQAVEGAAVPFPPGGEQPGDVGGKGGVVARQRLYSAGVKRI
jgi:hypothetical protein